MDIEVRNLGLLPGVRPIVNMDIEGIYLENTNLRIIPLDKLVQNKYYVYYYKSKIDRKLYPTKLSLRV